MPSSDFLARGQQFADKIRLRSLATTRSVIYWRKGGATSYDLTDVATVGQSEDRIDPNTSTVGAIETERRDYIFPASSLPGEPASGDWIVEESATGASHIYMVVARKGQPTWRWHGRENENYRVHTIYKGE